MKKTNKQYPRKKVYEAFRRLFYQERNCYICGEFGKIQYHHVDPNKKWEISSMWSHKRENLMKEIAKCIPVCKKCHKNIHRSEPK